MNLAGQTRGHGDNQQETSSQDRIKGQWRKFSHLLAESLHLGYPLASGICFEPGDACDYGESPILPSSKRIFIVVSFCLCSTTKNWEGLRMR